MYVINITDSVPDPILTSNTYEILMLVQLIPLFLISLLGVVTNVINILVFTKQGVTSDSTTLSLFALTLSDLLACVFMLPHPLCFVLQRFVVSHELLIRNCLVLSTMSATYPHILCTQIACWVTVYISVERALSVLFPLQVKLLIKYKNTAAVLMFIYGAEIVGHVPYLVNSPILWIRDASKNDTLMAINYQTPLGVSLYAYSNLIESNILITVAMLIITGSTLATLERIRTSSAWRNTMRSNVKLSKSQSLQSTAEIKSEIVRPDKITTKDKETVKMVASVTCCLLVCLACFQIPGLAMYAIPEFSLTGYNKDIFQVFYTFKFILDTLSASINFFFYVNQSSRFRKTYNSISPQLRR
ncbi:growth hormone secretagogue receptor type 1 [Biomphalaria pfeifferi]|uniref:Growth hormone secretagogue receptor type 1 n=1 Tax=Biomphalaria pfeifferi TaxID=112525 RepID=A0AAD8APK3_BIOPF|nr:growth hormone secretagogue receptor type 1 [Biomphalaria pfeifferi]